MIETRFTQLVDCTAPIQLAAMPGVGTPALVSAVAAAGGLGMLPATLMSPEVLGRTLLELNEREPGATGVNFLMPFLDRECVSIAARHSRLVEFFYGDPDPALVAHVRSLGARVSWQVGSCEEALAAERAGCDLVVVQGTEAGGHVRGETSLLPLLSQVLDVLRVPVLAAGGIATARDLAAVLGCGASGARVGTRFVAATESGAHPVYVSALIAASAADTCLTEAFSVMWPNAPHRVLRSAVAAAEALEDDVAGETSLAGQALPVPRFSVISPTRETKGAVGAMALYAGESVTNVREVQPAASIVADLVSGVPAVPQRPRRGDPEGAVMHSYFEAEPGRPFDPGGIVASCIESGARSLLLDASALPADFFDLSTGLAGELLHKLDMYRLRLAGVVSDPSAHPARFQEFLRETNRGARFRFFPSREEALRWLESI